MDHSTQKHDGTHAGDFDRDFRPNGAIAFFVVLVAIGVLTWYTIYLLMLNRI